MGVFSVDHRSCQSVVRTPVTYLAVSRVPLFCFYHTLMPSVFMEYVFFLIEPCLRLQILLCVIQFYIISSVIYAIWLVLTYDLLEDRCIDDVIIKTFFNSLLYKTNRFQVVVRLFSNRSQRTSKCGKNISDTLSCALCATFLILPHFDVICDLLLNRRTAIWNLFAKYLGASVFPRTCRIYWVLV